MSTISDRKLKWLHGSAAICHLVQAAYAEALVNTTFKDDGIFSIANQVYLQTNKIGEYQLTQIIPVFSFLSAVNHSWAVFDFERYKGYVEKGYNPVRWAEYSASAGLMNYFIASLSGVSDIKTLIGGLIIPNIAMQYLGYSLEKDTGVALAEKNRLISMHVYDSAKRQEIAGFLVFFGYLSIIWSSFFTAIEQSSQQVPDFVYAIIFIISALYLTFGLLSVAYLRGANPDIQGTGFWKLRETDFRKVEVGYIVLSLVAKTFLLNMALFGSVRPQETASPTPSRS